MPALFIGRFQPFHLGHLSVIKKAVKENDYLYIGIGSAEENFRPDNPFTAGERFQMIQAALDEAKIPREKYSIVPIRNINNYVLWPRHVELYLPPFSKIYTGSEIVKEIYQQENSGRKNPYKIISIKIDPRYSATKIRALMLKNQQWEKSVPKSTAILIKNFKGQVRLKNIMACSGSSEK